MKFWFPALALFATVSLPALAQEAPPPGAMRPDAESAMAAPSAERMAAMQKMHEQLREIRTQSRLQMLGSLSAAHRAALANIIGQLAIAPQPNRRAAEAQIDALLSPAEKNAVLTAETTARTNSRTLMESVRTQFEASLSADDRAKMEARQAERAEKRAGQARPEPVPDAGRTLLRISEVGGEGGPAMGGRLGEFMRGPGPGGAPN